MITVHIRKQGGAAIMTIPSDILKMMNVDIGSTLELEITKKGLVARPFTQKTTSRKRYTLKQLLHGISPKEIKRLNKDLQWSREGKPIGRELI